jgi:hypothetical protein
VRKKYRSKARKSNHKFEVVGEEELSRRMPLPMAELWAEEGRFSTGSRSAWNRRHSRNRGELAFAFQGGALVLVLAR